MSEIHVTGGGLLSQYLKGQIADQPTQRLEAPNQTVQIKSPNFPNGMLVNIKELRKMNYWYIAVPRVFISNPRQTSNMDNYNFYLIPGINSNQDLRLLDVGNFEALKLDAEERDDTGRFAAELLMEETGGIKQKICFVNPSFT